MKPTHLLVGSVATLIVGGTWLVFLRAESKTLAGEVDQVRAALLDKSGMLTRKNTEQAAEQAALGAQLNELRAKTLREEQIAAKLAAQNTALEAKIPPVTDDEMVVSFGRIRDMAAEIGRLAAVNIRMARAQAKPPGPEEVETFGRTGMKIMTWQPEIAAFEENAAEIASLQAGMLATAYELDPSTQARLERLIGDHFAQMKAAGATAASKDKPGWQDQRKAWITELMWKVRPLLPADAEVRRSLPMTLNLGAGMEKKVEVKPGPNGESKGSVSIGFPTWPTVPWIQDQSPAAAR